MIERWPPQFLTGETIGNFLVVFKLILYNDQYIFAITSFAPKDVCARMAARIRIFQTTGSSNVDTTSNVASIQEGLNQGPFLWQDASTRYHQTKLLPRLEWTGNIVLADMTDSQLDKDPRVLRVPASVIHRLGNQNSGNRLCEVLVDVTLSDPLTSQRDYCVVDDQTPTGMAGAAAAAAAAANLISLSGNNPPLLNSEAASSSSTVATTAAENEMEMVFVDPESNTTGEYPFLS
jgi:hypothetical protein